MSLVNVRVNTTTRNMEAISSPRSPQPRNNKLFKWKADDSEQLFQTHSERETTPTLSRSFMARERRIRECLTLIMFVQVRQAKTQGEKKKKKVSASHKPSALFLPQPFPPPSKVSSHPSLLPAPLFLRSLSFLFVDNTDWVTRCWAHTGSHTLKGGQVQKLKKYIV